MKFVWTWMLVLGFGFNVHAQGLTVPQQQWGYSPMIMGMQSSLGPQSVMDLELRIQYLERMVWQLQQQLMLTQGAHIFNDLGWICTIETSSETFTGLGTTQAMAETQAINNCKRDKTGSKILCRRPVCKQ